MCPCCSSTNEKTFTCTRQPRTSSYLSDEFLPCLSNVQTLITQAKFDSQRSQNHSTLICLGFVALTTLPYHLLVSACDSELVSIIEGRIPIECASTTVSPQLPSLSRMASAWRPECARPDWPTSIRVNLSAVKPVTATHSRPNRLI